MAPGFAFAFTAAAAARCLPGFADSAKPFAALQVLPAHGITSAVRVAGLLAQCGHESCDFTVLQENLNYSARGLCTVFPRVFPDLAGAARYARQPEKIANRVYGGRLGKGNEASGDGWRFRGRGVIQLTGKGNYAKFGRTTGRTLTQTVAYLQTLEGAVAGGGWFWSTHDLNLLADAEDIVGMTRRINGGTRGLGDRQARFVRNLQVLRG